MSTRINQHTFIESPDSRTVKRRCATGQQATLCCVVAMAVAVLSGTRFCVAQSSEPLEEIPGPRLLTFHDPEFVFPKPIRRLPPSYLDLWIEGLSGPEYELKREVAIDIRRAHQDGYSDCTPATDALMKVLQDQTAPRSVLTEVARALIALDARQCSTRFKQLLRDGSGTLFEMHVEPALARWNDSEMPLIWQQRLTDRTAPRHRRLIAIQAFANAELQPTDSAQFYEDLQRLVTTGIDTSIRLEAAQILGDMKRAGLETLAETLLFSPLDASGVDGLAGFQLLRHHTSTNSGALLLKAVRERLEDSHKSPFVRLAWQRLLELEVAGISEFAARAIGNPDAEVRQLAVNTIGHYPSDEGIQLLGQTLDDRHPGVRLAARQTLLRISSNDLFNEAVRRAGSKAIADSSWRSQEQAIILLAVLNQSNAASRMLPLLDVPRAEVAVAAAWGLRRLNVTELASDVLEQAELLDARIIDGQTLNPHDQIVLAHLFEALSMAKHREAIPVLKRWLPKEEPRLYLNEARSAAVWSLGRIYGNSRDEALARILNARFMDPDQVLPETKEVRIAAAVALGRIGSPIAVEDLRRYTKSFGNESNLAAAWAIERITGETFPKPKPSVDGGKHWKLSPVGE